MQASACSCILGGMPKSPAEEELAQALLQAAASAGLRVTSTQLRDWRQAGLLPSPRQRGLGRGRGTETLYPAGSTEQLLALCELRKKCRSLDTICWGLWWRRYPVSESRIRRLFEGQLAFPTAVRDRLQRDDEAAERDDDEDFGFLIEEAGRGRLSSPSMRLIRKQVGSANFPKLLVILTNLFTGIDPYMFDGDSEILVRALADDNSSDAAVSPVDISRAFVPHKLSSALKAASIQDLEAARDEIRSVFELAREATALIELVVSPAFAVPLLELFRDPLPADGLHVILLWLQLRRSQQARELLAKAMEVLNRLRRGELTASEALERDL